MEHRLTQQGTQTSKLMPEVYKELKEQHAGSAALDSYTSASKTIQASIV